MSDQSSHRILGIIYFNPDDSRILVPMRSKLGLTINFGHPHAVTAFSWLVGIYLLGLTVAPIIAHPHWFAREPSDLVWLVSSDLVAGPSALQRLVQVGGLPAALPGIVWIDRSRDWICGSSSH
jgi:hypothetical protein